LAHFCWVLLIVTAEKGKAIEKSYSDDRSFVTFILRVSYCDNRELVFMFDFDTKQKRHQSTRQSDLYSAICTPCTNQKVPFYYLGKTLLLSKLELQQKQVPYTYMKSCHIIE
jgi:hypothetical protein